MGNILKELATGLAEEKDDFDMTATMGVNCFIRAGLGDTMLVISEMISNGLLDNWDDDHKQHEVHLFSILNEQIWKAECWCTIKAIGMHKEGLVDRQVNSCHWEVVTGKAWLDKL